MVLPTTRRKKVDNFIQQMISVNPDMIELQYDGNEKLAVKSLHKSYNLLEKRRKLRR